jgi:hypothetical protein
MVYRLGVNPSRRKPTRPVLDSIRKPTAPGNKKIGERRPDERVHPSRRQTKHKKKETDAE